jgi:hypothetical protein
MVAFPYVFGQDHRSRKNVQYRFPDGDIAPAQAQAIFGKLAKHGGVGLCEIALNLHMATLWPCTHGGKVN